MIGSYLDTMPDSIHREIEAGTEAQGYALQRYQQIAKRYSDRSKLVEETEAQWPENHAFEYLSYMVPEVAFETPRTSCRSRREVATMVLTKIRLMMEQGVAAGVLDPVLAQQKLDELEARSGSAQAMEHGLNRWSREEQLYATLDPLAYDFLMGHGCARGHMDVMPGEDPRDPNSKRWPKLCRVPPPHALMDPDATTDRDALWHGHWELEVKKTLLDNAKQELAEDPDAGWDLKAINALAEAKSFAGDGSITDVAAWRGMVQVYHLWVRTVDEPDWPTPNEGFHGALLTVAAVDKGGSEAKAEFIRKPVPYWGPPSGPYTWFSCYFDPECPYGLAPLSATAPQAEELNAHAKAMNMNARQFKRLLFCRAEVAEFIESAPDQLVIPVTDVDWDKDLVVVQEVGGIHPTQMAQYELMKDRLERVSGLQGTKRGELDADVTATAVADAAGAEKVRASYVQARFAKAVQRCLEFVAWYLFNDDRIEFPLGPEAGEQIDNPAPVFEGGPNPDDPEESFNDLELEIDAYSMQRVDEALLQKRVLEAVGQLIAMAPLMIQHPHIDWREVVRRVGDVMNIPDLVDMVNFDQLLQLGQQMAAQGMGGQDMSVDGANRYVNDQAGNAQATGQETGAMVGAASSAA